MSEYRLLMLTPSGKAVDAPVESAVLPGLDGRFGVLAGHADMLAGVSAGIMTYVKQGVTHSVLVGDGIASVNRGALKVRVEFVEEAPSALDAEERLENWKKRRAALIKTIAADVRGMV